MYTRQFDLVVMNGGAGELPTDEGLAQAVAALAHAVARNEARGARQPVAGCCRTASACSATPRGRSCADGATR